MSEDPVTVERYDGLSDEALQARLEAERRALRTDDLADQRLLHELRVYQIELEMQNRELRETQSLLEASRDHYASLYHDAPLGYVLLDRRGRIRDLNRTARRLLRLGERDPDGQYLGVFVARDDVAVLQRHLQRCAAGRLDVAEELTLKALDGTPLPVRLESVPAGGPGGEPFCRTALIDLSAQRRAEAEAREQRDALAHAARLGTLGEMASAVGHELGQPLTAIDTYAEVARQALAAESPDRARLAEALDGVAAGTARCRELLQGLRRFARRQPAQRHPVALPELVEETLALLEPELREAGVRLEVDCGRLLPPVTVEPVQVEQVLVNLVRNAVEALRGAGAPEGRVRIRARAPDRDHVEVRVLDNGPGLDPEVAEKVFMPFNTNKPEGLGLGLSLSRSLIEAHGGHLRLCREGPGACFAFTLPVGVA